MAVTQIEITQTNFKDNCRLLAVHSDLYFYFDATYTGTPPYYLIVELTVDGISYITGKALFYEDLTNNKRRFIFNATEFAKALIYEQIDDFEQSDYTIIETGISKIITVVVKSDIAGTISETFQFEAINAVRQDYEDVAMIDIVNNQEDIYFAIEGEPVYVYFYGDELIRETNYALDYNDDYFVDYNNDKFIID